MNQIISNPARVYGFVRQYVPVNIVAGAQALGLEKDGELIAGVLYEDYNGTNIWMHCASSQSERKRWLNKLFLKSCFHYPFVTLGCSRVSVYVEESNTDSRTFVEHLGFKPEAVLHGAAKDGKDAILYVMWRKDCRFLVEKKS